PTLSIADTSVVEGNSGETEAIFTVTLSAASAQVISVDYRIADGTASAGADYATTFGGLWFYPGGPLQQQFHVFVHGDTEPEPDEMFLVNLINPVNAGLSRAQAVGTILTDDPTQPTLSIADASAPEDNFARFTVSLSAATSRTVTVDYSTQDGTAHSYDDY